jgi:hypothetical protein
MTGLGQMQPWRQCARSSHCYLRITACLPYEGGDSQQTEFRKNSLEKLLMSRGDELRKKFAAKAAANPFDELKAC